MELNSDEHLEEALLDAQSMRELGWASLVLLLVVAFGLLSFTVQAKRNEVVLAERQIVRLQSILKQMQLEESSRLNFGDQRDLNRIAIGYTAPRADQFITDLRDLAQFSASASAALDETPQTAERGPEN